MKLHGPNPAITASRYRASQEVVILVPKMFVYQQGMEPNWKLSTIDD
jgi:hypothetical protein